MKKQIRLKPELRRAQMIDAAIKIAQEKGSLAAVTRQMIADVCGVTKLVVNHRFGGMEQLRAAVLDESARLGIELRP